MRLGNEPLATVLTWYHIRYFFGRLEQRAWPTGCHSFAGPLSDHQCPMDQFSERANEAVDRLSTASLG